MAETTKKYTQTVGRRKRAVAQVRLSEGTGQIVVNGRKFEEYFPEETLQIMVKSPLVETGSDKMFDVSIKVKGGGISGQAGSARHGIARALVEKNESYKTVLKKLGFMTRDARRRERKKYGKKSARRSPQWSKR